MEKIIIKPHDSEIKIYFEKEKKFLEKNLVTKCWINHVGSTAVFGLGGKNILDIQLLVSTKKVALDTLKKLRKMKYRYTGRGGDKFRFFLERNKQFDRKIHIHLHLMWKTSNQYKKHLIFRDYLIKHPEECRKYFSLKKKWAKKFKGEPGTKFCDLKTEYIKNVLKKAIK